MLATLCVGAGSMALAGGVAAASTRPVQSGSATPPGTPKGSTGVLGEHFVKFCVKNFKPGTTVKVVNTLTGQTVEIHTNSKGAGCVQVPIKRACKALTQTIVATGTGADGKPATVTQTVTAPATPSLCSGTSSSGGTLPFTGSDIIIPGIIIGVVLIATGAGLTVVRRRRTETV